MFSGNDLPIGPTGSFPPQRIQTNDRMLPPPSDAEGAYMNNPFVQLPTEEKEYSSVADRAKMHLTFGEPLPTVKSLRAMGGGFQRDRQRAALKNAKSMPGHRNPRMLSDIDNGDGDDDNLSGGRGMSMFGGLLYRLRRAALHGDRSGSF